jgi:serine protease Do
MSRFTRWPLAVACLGLGLAGGFLASQRLIGQPPPRPPEPALVLREVASFSPVVKRVLPAVVSVEGKVKPRPKPAPKADPQPDEEPEFGSGVVIDPSGVVLTSNHVVQGAESVEVTLHDGRKFVTRDIRRDPKSDLAVIRVPAKDPLPFLELGDSDAMEVGDRVLAFGSPFGLAGSVTHGIVSAKSRSNMRLNQYEDFLQTDAAVNPGSSGGPLVNLEGKVVGINAAIKTRSGGFSGVGLAVASNLAKTVAPQLAKDGVVRRGYLGANVRDLDPDAAAKAGVKAGAVVTRVYENSPAAKAGLVVGDVITSIAGRPIADGVAVQRVITPLPLNQVVDVGIVRGGQQAVARLTVEEQPPAPANAAQPMAVAPGTIPLTDLGLAVADLTPEMAKRLRYPGNTQGAVVVAVTRDGIAEHAGLRAGQVVVKVDKTPVASAEALRQAVAVARKDRGALLQVLRPTGELDFVILKLP